MHPVYRVIGEKLDQLQQETAGLRQGILDFTGQINIENKDQAAQISTNQSKKLKKLIPPLKSDLKQIKLFNKKKRSKKSTIYFGHQNWNIVLNMMLGIQASLKSLIIFPEQIRSEFTKQHFKQKYYFQLMPRRTTNQKDMFKICQFFDYAPYIFYEIRRIYGISNESYLKSLGVENLLCSIVKGDLKAPSELVTSGKSGSLFYYSEDGQFTLKTISRSEFKHLQTIIKPYYYHFCNNNNSLMIPLKLVNQLKKRYFGLHKLQAKKVQSWLTKKIYFVIMKNVFFTAQEIHKRYDLKGSTYKRFTNDQDQSVARKDLNAIEDNFKLQLSDEDIEIFKQQIDNDSQFFEKNNIIDYSLLVGIHDTSQVQQLENSSLMTGQKTQNAGRGIYYSKNKQFIYYIGIIDFLTSYKLKILKKSLEHAIKLIVQGNTISSLPPKAYASRFQNFMKQLVNFDQKNHVPTKEFQKIIIN